MKTIETPYGTLRTQLESLADTAFLVALHESVKWVELVTMPVGDPIRRQLLDMQFRAMTISYRPSFPAGRFDIISLNAAPIGRLITDNAHDRFDIVYIVLLPDWRRRGIATA